MQNLQLFKNYNSVQKGFIKKIIFFQDYFKNIIFQKLKFSNKNSVFNLIFLD